LIDVDESHGGNNCRPVFCSSLLVGTYLKSAACVVVPNNRAAQEHLPISLLFFNVGNFKAFNGTYGYATGDECLRSIAQAAHEALAQAGQAVARYRGAEFVALLFGTGAEDARSVLHHLHKTIEALDLGPIVDVGVATAFPNTTNSRADLLTSAKNAVPNRK
jgi:diguanylate cyclase (GGDEF)-like protein